MLAHRLPDAMGNAAMDLAMHDHRIDGTANIIDGRIARDFYDTGVRIHLDLADMAAIGELARLTVSSLSAASGPRRSSDRSLRCSAAAATSKMSTPRSVPLTRN